MADYEPTRRLEPVRHPEGSEGPPESRTALKFGGECRAREEVPPELSLNKRFSQRAFSCLFQRNLLPLIILNAKIHCVFAP